MTTLLTVLPELAVPAVDNPKADFSDTPWWLSLIKAVLIFVYLLISTLLVIWFERRVIGRMQQRPGPNRTGPFGLLQTLADGMKSMLKEDVTPAAADKVIFTLAPLIAATMAFVSFAIIPLGDKASMFGHMTPLQLTDFPVAVLLVLAVASVGVYGIILAGWSSGSTYPLLGGLRSTAQVISYEIAMGLALVAVFIYSGSMSTSQIVSGQSSLWYIAPGLFSFAVYVVTMVGETNRLPFDLAEGEGELTGGFHTEYGSMRFAMFFLAEYINMFTVSALATTMFLGGWRAPWPITAVWHGANAGYFGVIWFFAKVLILLFGFIWLRATLPRMRYDQFMRFGWKVLIPVNLVWILFLAGVRVTNDRIEGGARWLVYLAAAVVVLGIALLWPASKKERVYSIEEQLAARPPGSFPVPPMDLQVPPSPRARRAVAERQPATVGSPDPSLSDTSDKEV